MDYLDSAVERSAELAYEQDELMEQTQEEMGWQEFDEDGPNLFDMRW